MKYCRLVQSGKTFCNSIYALNQHRLSLGPSHLGSPQSCPRFGKQPSMQSPTRWSFTINSPLPLDGSRTTTEHSARTHIRPLPATGGRERARNRVRRHTIKSKKAKISTQAMRQIRNRIRRPPIGKHRRNGSSSAGPLNGQDSQPRDRQAPAECTLSRSQRIAQVQQEMGPSAPSRHGKSAAEYIMWHAAKRDRVAAE